ncbi:ABC transporter ATP-binding protein [Thermosphaera aggregans]|uniref:ABC transporter related protein n=1 Tax=Thermosphaera aggregans (strain DSM 11486 / M11TL) TaxID=633148 RepID=D5U0T4_THEAM|nr:ATP-binding cassette domain-containing protein [Thermosphaera aggregans]ADG90734.1 ABC transporter related protein [Thermosphaera aggregans DSM 11486]
MITAKIAEAGFSEDKPIIKNIYVESPKASVTLLLGESGSGKTTFLLSLTGVLKFLLNGYVNGLVRIDDLNPLEMNDYLKLPSKIGFIMQDPEKQLVMPTPFDETVFTLQMKGYSEEEAVKKARELLEKAGLSNKINLHVENLSGGEKRRLSILLSIIHQPQILILDEPSASLDVEGIRMVREIVRKYKERENTTVLIAEHKPVFYADLIDNAFIIEKTGSKRVTLETLHKSSVVDIARHQCAEKSKDNGSFGEVVLETYGLDIGFDKPMIRNINLTVRSGEAIGILGPNGSGKTTLLKTIAGFYRPLTGEIRVREGGRVFYVPQNPDLLFLFKTVEKELKETSKKTSFPVDELVELIPWYPSVKGLNPHWLSHGQRRWLSIVIAYAYSRGVILLDEPSTGLDYVRFNHLKRLITGLKKKGVSFLISTHDPRVVGEIVDKVYVIDNGRLIEVDKCRAVEEYYSRTGVSA